MKFCLLAATVLLAAACSTLTETETALIPGDTVATSPEPYRLAYHFSPEKNWMNDPNGLVYHNGKYHLFYQYNPEGDTWGNMSWGHATTEDLVHWNRRPLAIPMDGENMIFSGSAVVDKNNSSGLCNADDGGCLVAIYTSHLPELQTQALAYSNDDGETWMQYEGNPVLDEGMKDFRDPKVFWHEPKQAWLMALAIPQEQKIRFYQSPNLKDWTRLSEFGPAGFVDGIWECPDLFELPVENGEGSRWVLIVSHNRSNMGPTMQYFVGDFDGTTFTNTNTDDLILRVDEGLDYYAAVTYNNVPDDRRLMIGWLNNWAYGQKIPTSGWRSAQSLVRTLHLRQFPEGVRLVQQPVEEQNTLRETARHYENQQINEGDDFLSVENVRGSQLEIVAEFVYRAIETPAEAEQLASEFGIEVFEGEGQETVIGYDVASQSVFVDRTQSGDTTFSENFAARTIGLMPSDDGIVRLRIFVDHSSVEVFGNDGYVAMTNRIFPDQAKNGVEVYAIGGPVTLRSLDIYPVKSIWNDGMAQVEAGGQ